MNEMRRRVVRCRLSIIICCVAAGCIAERQSDDVRTSASHLNVSELTNAVPHRRNESLSSDEMCRERAQRAFATNDIGTALLEWRKTKDKTLSDMLSIVDCCILLDDFDSAFAILQEIGMFWPGECPDYTNRVKQILEMMRVKRYKSTRPRGVTAGSPVANLMGIILLGGSGSPFTIHFGSGE